MKNSIKSVTKILFSKYVFLKFFVKRFGNDRQIIRKSMLIHLMIIITIFLLVLLESYAFLFSQKHISFINIAIIVISLLIFLIHLYKIRNIQKTADLIIVITFLFYSWLLMGGEAKDSGYFWLYTYPLFAVFLSGSKYGSLSALGLGLVALVFLGFEKDLGLFSYLSNTEKSRLIITYLVVVAFAFMAEYMRERNSWKIKNYQKNLKLTIRKQTYELRKKNKDLLNANQAKIKFLQRMSHELKTPLSSILGSFDLLKETELNVDQQILMEMGRYNAKHFIHLVNDLLDFAKSLDGKIKIREEETDLHQLLISVYNAFKSEATKKDLEYNISLDNNLKKNIYTDPNRLYQILANLLSNAIKNTKQGKVEIKVKYINRSPSNNEMIAFEVSDTGVGLEEQEIDKIFDEFYRIETRDNDYELGTGLGLAICRNLSSLLHGEIEIESKLNQGSVFRLLIPCKLIVDEIESPPKPLFKSEIKGDFFEYLENVHDSSIEMLLVEDNVDIKFLVEKFLYHSKINIDHAFNGQQAFELFKQNNYDIVLMDLEMPIMGGYESVNKIREYEQLEKKKSVPIIAMSAHGYEEEFDRALAIGCSSYLSKPIDKDILFDILLKSLHKNFLTLQSRSIC